MHFGDLHQFLWCSMTVAYQMFSRFTWLNENIILNQVNAKHLYFHIYIHTHMSVCCLKENYFNYCIFYQNMKVISFLGWRQSLQEPQD